VFASYQGTWELVLMANFGTERVRSHWGYPTVPDHFRAHPMSMVASKRVGVCDRSQLGRRRCRNCPNPKRPCLLSQTKEVVEGSKPRSTSRPCV
jgi:hypothetical protein